MMSEIKIISKDDKPFKSREDAGRQLAEQLMEFKEKNPLILGIPRGGVVTAKYIAQHLEAEMDIVLTHKIGAPRNPELAIGAVMENGNYFVNEKMASYAMADENYIKKEKNAEQERLKKNVDTFRKVKTRIPLENRIVIITDDGLATGATMRAALQAAKQELPELLIAAVPVAPQDALESVSQIADKTICLKVPSYFGALSMFYSSFSQIEDDEVSEILKNT